MSAAAAVFLSCRQDLRDAGISGDDARFDVAWDACKLLSAVLIGRGCGK